MSEQMKKTNGLPQFAGPFRELIPEYISYKRSQGYKFGNPIVYRLREMDLFFKDLGVEDISITREMYDAWTSHKPPEKEQNIQKRQNAIRGFAKYLVSRGYPDIYAGQDDSRIFKRDFIPYVFTREEIGRMFFILHKHCEESPGYENDTFRMAMLLYYCCGFRKSEVLNLQIQDVDFQTGKISILHGKNDVSRIVVASRTLLSELNCYRDKYLLSAEPDEYFLHGLKSNRYCEAVLYSRFHQLLADAGIMPRKDGGRQRLHDVRHTFCVRALEQMQEKGFDLYTSLPLLSRHLGHKHITETEYYLRLLEDHFDGILSRSASCHPGIFPKYEGGDADE